jgi:hypothetical protein
MVIRTVRRGIIGVSLTDARSILPTGAVQTFAPVAGSCPLDQCRT